MSTVLRQRRFFVTKIFETTDRSLRVKISNLTSSFESEYPYEDIGRRLIYKRSISLKTLIPAIVMFLGLVITLIDRLEGNTKNTFDIMVYLVLFPLFALLTLLNKEDNIFFVISNLQGAEMFASSPSKVEVERFLETLREKQKVYLLKRYAAEDPYISPEQYITNLKWLYDRDVINDAELADLRYQLIEKPKFGNAMSFNFSSN
jgi:hypothetical protein